jgi:uncharacterized membrane protein
MQTLLVTLHVVAAVFLVGPMAILPMIAMRAVRAEQGRMVEILARSTFLYSLLSLIVVLLGFAVLPYSKDRYGTTITTPWVLISLICFVVALALNLLAVVPSLRSAAEHILDPQAQELRKADYSRIAMTSGVTSLLLVAIVVLMVWKP